jgi:hypothetical protein
MTDQEMFDTVVAHARKQGCKAMNGYTCSYRTSYGAKCFIGALIPDDKYKEEFEAIGLCMLREDEGHEKNAKAKAITDAAGIKKEQYEFAIALQNIHDAFDVEQWETQFKQLAAQYKLTYTPPTI